MNENFKTKNRDDFSIIKSRCLSVKDFSSSTNHKIDTLYSKNVQHYSVASSMEPTTEEALTRVTDMLQTFLGMSVAVTSYQTNVISVLSYVRTYGVEEEEPMVYISVNVDKALRGLYFGKGCINLNMMRMLVARLFSVCKIKAYIEFIDN